MKITLDMSGISPKFNEQLAKYGLILDHPDRYDRIKESLCMLKLHGYIPRSKYDWGKNKLFDEILAASREIKEEICK